MFRTLLLARRYIAFHKAKTAILVCCLTLTAYLPLAVHCLVDHYHARLTARAEATPLIVGAKGSRFDLALHALYFTAEAPDTITVQEVREIRESRFADPIPLLIRFKARGFPIVGTTLDYFDFRRLEVVEGSPLVQLGDCVLGANVAGALDLAPGDRLMSDPENVFDIASTYPLNMRVVGVLAKAHSGDDYAVFVDVKTVWVIQGLGHGHQDLAATEDPNVILERTDKEVVANAALLHYTEITPENLASFHFHGPVDDFPITAVIAVPSGLKSEILLTGRYDSKRARAQLLKPVKVVEELMGMVLRVERFFDANMVLVGVATVLFLVLVVMLSLRLRRREMETMFKLGCSRLTIFRLQATELGMILAVSFALAGLLALATLQYAPYLMRELMF